MSSENQEVSILPRPSVDAGNLKARKESQQNLSKSVEELPSVMRAFAQSRADILSVIREPGSTMFLQELQEKLRLHNKETWEILNTPAALRRQFDSTQRTLFEWEAAVHYVSAGIKISLESDDHRDALSVDECFRLMRILVDKHVASFREDGSSFSISLQNMAGEALVKKLGLRELIENEVLPRFREAHDLYHKRVHELKEKATVKEWTTSEIMVDPEEGCTFVLFAPEKTDFGTGDKKRGRRTLAGMILVELCEIEIGFKDGKGDFQTQYSGWVLSPMEVVDMPPSISFLAMNEKKRPRFIEDALSDVVSTSVELPLSSFENIVGNRMNLPYRVDHKEDSFRTLNTWNVLSGALQKVTRLENFRKEFSDEQFELYDHLQELEKSGVTVYEEEEGYKKFFSVTRPSGATYICFAGAGEQPWKEKLRGKDGEVVRTNNRFGVHVVLHRKDDKGPIEVASFPPRLKDFFENENGIKMLISYFVNHFGEKVVKQSSTTDKADEETTPLTKEGSVETSTQPKVSAGAQKLADAHKIDIAGIVGTGANGTVLKSDVEKMV